MATNNMLPFCPTDTGTNLLSQTDYAAASDRTNGNQPGIASSKLVNKAVRQSAWMASQLAQYIANATGLDVLDDQNSTNLLTAMTTAFVPEPIQSQIQNLTLTFAVAGNAGTVAIKTYAGTDAATTNPINVAMRSSTITSGGFSLRSITAALSMTITSGATLGQSNGNPSRVYVYLIDNAGTLELAVSHSFFSESQLITTTAMSSSASSVLTMYSTAARTNVPFVCIGYILNTQATAGTWVTTASQIQLLPTQGKGAPTIQKFTSGSGTYVTPPGVLYLRVRMVGGGSGGGGSGTSASLTGGVLGGVGGNTTFGTTLLVANGGAAGGAPGGGGGNGAIGGTASLGAAIGIAISGATGGGGGANSTSTVTVPGGGGGVSPFGGGGSAGSGGNAGGAAIANTGSGGGGGGCGTGGVSSTLSGGGGGSAGFVDAILTTPLASYAYAVGAAGAAGTAGTSGSTGGAGGSGLIEVTEYYV